jgi:uncharacterized protein
MNAVPKFTEAHAARLSRFLSAPGRPEGTMTYPQLAGFLFSVACAPEVIPPSEWMPIVFNDQDAGFETPREAEQVIEAMMALYNECGRQGTEEGEALPPGCEILSPPLRNLEEDAPLSRWARGFVTGSSWLEEIWDELTPDELDEELGGILLILSFFASPKLAEACIKEAKRPLTPERVAETVVKTFPDAATGYARMGRIFHQALLEVEKDAPEEKPPGRPKVGRNDPCPCGSGKKFKKCCAGT